MASDQVMILLVISFKNIVDLAVQCILLLSFVFVRITLGVIATGVEFLYSSVVERYRYISCRKIRNTKSNPMLKYFAILETNIKILQSVQLLR